MRNVFLFFTLLCSSIYSQIAYGNNIYTVLDDFYSEILFLEEPAQLVSTKIYYPGLVSDYNSSATLGFLPKPVYAISSPYSPYDNLVNPHISLLWSDLYGWSEMNSSIGKIGFWIGNLNAEHNKYEYQNENMDHNQKGYGSCAFWFNPLNDIAFRGISLQIDGQYQSQSSKRSTSSSSYFSKTDYKGLALNANSMFRISSEININLGLTGSTFSQNNNIKFFNKYQNSSTSKTLYGAFTSGIVTNKGQQVNIALRASTDNNNSEDPNFSGYGNVQLTLEGSDGKMVSYLRHKFYFGVQGIAGIGWPVQSDSYISFSDLPREMKNDQREIFGALRIPFIIDFHLFDSDIYTIFNITPQVYGTYSRQKTEKSQLVNLNMNELAFGLKGRIGKRLEFSLIPSLRSNIFVTGMELKYLL